MNRATPVSAGHGYATFSVYDPGTNRYRLAIANGGSVAYPSSVAPRRYPFDAAVGDDRTGRAIVTFTQCRVGPHRPNRLNGLPFWADQRECQVRSLDIGSGRVSRLAIQKAKRGSAWLPVVSRGSLAYARLRDRGLITRSHKRLHRYRFEVARRTRSGKTRLLTGGPDATWEIEVGEAGSIIEQGGGVTSLAARGTEIAYTWAHAASQATCKPDPDDYITYGSEVYLEGGGDRRRISRGCSFGSPGLTSSVSFGSNGLLWTRVDPASGAQNLSLIGSWRAGTTASYDTVLSPAGSQPLTAVEDGTARWYLMVSERRVWITRVAKTA